MQRITQTAVTDRHRQRRSSSLPVRRDHLGTVPVTLWFQFTWIRSCKFQVSTLACAYLPSPMVIAAIPIPRSSRDIHISPHGPSPPVPFKLCSAEATYVPTINFATLHTRLCVSACALLLCGYILV